MSDSQQILGQMCRACMCKNQNFHSINDEADKPLTIHEMFATTIPQVSIHINDQLPKLICVPCLNKLKITYQFQQMCIASEKYMRKMLLGLVENLGKRTETPEETQLVDNPPKSEYVSLESGEEFLENNDILSERSGSDNSSDCNQVKSTSKIKGTKQQHCIANILNETGIVEIEKPNVRNRRKNELPCPHCNKVFDRPYRLKRHAGVHRETLPYSCEICKYRFKTANQLAGHKASHDGGKLMEKLPPPEGYKCPDCPRRFEKSNSLAAHTRVHRKPDPNQIFKCCLCPKRFRKITTLSQHALTHPENQKQQKDLQHKALAEETEKFNGVHDPLSIKTETNDEALNESVLLESTYLNKMDMDSEWSDGDDIPLETVNRNPLETGALQGCIKFEISEVEVEECDLKTYMSKKEEKNEDAYKELNVDNNSKHLENNTSTDPNSADNVDCQMKTLSKERKTEQNAFTPNINDTADETRVNTIEKPNAQFNRKYNFCCEKCDAAFSCNDKLQKHFRVHLQANPFVCEICNYRFKRISSLSYHTAVKHETVPPDGFKCPDCPRRFEKSDSLRRHTISHQKMLPDQCKFKCNLCPKKFQNLSSLTQHARLHPENKKFKCTSCEASFSLSSKLENHMHKHNGLYICEHCKKGFKKKIVLKEHLRIHTGERPYLCPQCGKSFRTSSGLADHRKRHSNIKPCQCTECPRTFSCHSDRIKHMRVHRDIKPHSCDICGSRFTRANSLREHMAIHTGERPHKCDECSLKFVCKFKLKRHQRSHTGDKPHKCKLCEKAYALKGDLTKHMRIHLGDKTYFCEECPEKFKYQKELLSHQSAHFKQKKIESLNDMQKNVEESTI